MNHLIRSITDLDSFVTVTRQIMEKEGYQKPAAFALGLIYHAADGKAMAVHFPHINAADENPGTAALFKEATATNTLGGGNSRSTTYVVDQRTLDALLEAYKPFDGDGKDHPNIRALQIVRKMVERPQPNGGNYKAVIVFIYDLEAHPNWLADAQLQLHLLFKQESRTAS